MPRFTKQQLRKKEFKEQRELVAKKRTINGRRVNQDDEFYSVEKGTKILKEAGFAKFQNTEMSENECAISLLANLGISINSHKRDFSLLNAQTNKTEIDIDTGDARESENNKSDPNDKFPNPNDPFYDLDQEPEILIQQKRKQILQMKAPYLVGLVSDIVRANGTSSIASLKYFMAASIESAQRDSMKYSSRVNMPAPAKGRGATAGSFMEHQDGKTHAMRTQRPRNRTKATKGY